MNSRVVCAYLVIFLTFSVGVMIPLDFSIFEVQLVKADYWQQDPYVDDSELLFDLEFDSSNVSYVFDSVNNLEGLISNESSAFVVRKSSFHSAYNSSLSQYPNNVFPSGLVNFTDDDVFDIPKNVSLEFFVNMDAGASIKTLFDHYDATNGGWRIQLDDDGSTYKVMFEVADEGDQYYTLKTNGTFIEEDKWQYVVITINWSSSLFGTLGSCNVGKIYINGSSVSVTQSNQSVNWDLANAFPFLIFNDYWGNEQSFNATIDVFKIHNKTFSPSEVANRWYLYSNYEGWHYITNQTGNYTVTNINPEPYINASVPGALIRASVLNPLFILLIVGVIALAIVTYYLFVRPRRKKRRPDEIRIVIEQK